MILYLLIPIIILIFSKEINKKKMTYIDYFLLLLLILICGLRKNVGTDYKLYELFYNNISAFPRIEFFFRQLILFLNKFNFDASFFFFITSLITIVPVYLYIKKNSDKPSESLFLYISLGFYALQFNMIRQMLAIIVTIFGFKYIKERNIIKYILFILFASLFHSTALIMLPFYFLANCNFSKFKMYLILILEFCLSFLYSPFMSFMTKTFKNYSVYEQANNFTMVDAGLGTHIILIFNLILLIFIIRKKDELIELDKRNKIYINLVLFSFMFYFLGLNNTVIIRVAYYLFIYIIFILPNLYRISKFYNNKNSFFIYIFFLIYYVLHLISFNNMLPYHSIF